MNWDFDDLKLGYVGTPPRLATVLWVEYCIAGTPLTLALWPVPRPRPAALGGEVGARLAVFDQQLQDLLARAKSP